MINFHIHSAWYRGFVLTALIAAALFQCPDACAKPAAVGQEVKFEVPGVLRAADVFPPELLSGPHYRVRDRVVSYGFMHHYVVDSDYGPFEVTGDYALRKLIREIGAIAALQEIKKGEAYINGIRHAARQPIEFGASLITDPVDTISGVPKGLASLFENVKTGLTAQAKPGEDDKLAQALAVSANKRQLAQQLGVDVYSSNKVLQKELNGIAWATSLGSLTVSAALAPVGGPAVLAVSLTRTAQQLHDMVNQYPPQKLFQINLEKLRAMGISEDLALRFLNYPIYTPTQDTIIVSSLEALPATMGREAFIRDSLTADSEESANYFTFVAQMLRGYSSKISPIREISVDGPLVFAAASNGTTMIPLPLDYAMWTQKAGSRVPAAVAAHKAANPGSKKYEFWITGTASKLVRDQAAKKDIKCVEKAGSQLDLVY